MDTVEEWTERERERERRGRRGEEDPREDYE